MARETWTFGIRRLAVKMASGTSPTALVWMDDRGVVGIDISESDEVTSEEIAESYRKATTAPMNGRSPGRPKKVRVESGALARRLRPLVAGVQIEIRPTPDLDAFVETMTEALEGPEAEDLALYLETPEPWRPELARLATELAQAEPWSVVLPEPPLELQIASLGVTDGRLAVMGHNGQTFGLMVFFSAADLGTFEEVAERAATSLASGDRGLPRCVSVNMATLATPPRGEVEDVALVTIFEGQERRAPSETETRIALAAGRALSAFVTYEARRLGEPGDWLRGIEGSFEVEALGQRVSVSLRAALIAKGELDAAILDASSGRPQSGKKSAAKKTPARPATTRTPTSRQISATTRSGAGASTALAYTNRMGDTYYLHQGRTKHGKPRYFFAREVGDGALATLPEGHEVSESINGVVSIRRIDPSRAPIAATDVAIVDAERARHAHLRYHRVQGERDAIVIYAPDRDAATLGQYALFPISDAKRDDWMRSSRYAPVFRFVPDGEKSYVAHRMTYRGKGGWSWDLGRGALHDLAKRFVSKIGTEAFFDLM